MRAPRYQFPSDDELRGRRVLVLGLGLYHGGASVVRFLNRLGCSITVTDLRRAEELAESIAEIEEIPVSLRLGEHRLEDLDRTEFAVVNPAIPYDAPFLRAAIERGIPLLSEAGMFFSRLRARFALITGSKGKTTTTSLLHAMAQRSDPTTLLGGNIGKPLLDRVHEIDERQTVIYEISSFQLETLRGLERHPEVVVMTNLFPVHIDRHGTFEDYREAKREVLSGARCVVLNAEDPEVRRFAEGFTGEVRWFSPKSAGGAWRLDGDSLRDPAGVELLRRDELRIPGLHNVANVLAAFAAADRLGFSREAALAATRAFPGVEHRLEWIGDRDGIRFVNDSIATTPQSALAALDALEGPIFLIGGGKESPFDLAALSVRVAERCRGFFGIGETGRKMVDAIRQRAAQFPAEYAETLEQALVRAKALAAPGDTVLLSPAYPSFDQFRNFKERGERFRKIALDRP